jgi:integrase
MHVTEAIERFHNDQRSLGMAASTLANHVSQLRKLARAARDIERLRGKRTPLRVTEIDGEVVAGYFAYCIGGDGNRNNMNAALRSFLDFCEREQWIKAGTRARLLARRRNQTYQRQPKVYVQASDFPALLDCQAVHPSHRMTMALLLYTLARKSEILALRISDVDLETKTLHIYRVKTRHWTDVGITPELAGELITYLEWYALETGCFHIKELDPDWFLLPRLNPLRPRSPDGKHFGKGTLYEIDPENSPTHMERIVKRGLDALGISTTRTGAVARHLGEGAHTIRRSGARAMLKHLSPIMGSADALVTVAAMLDHKDVKVTLRYIGMDQQKEELNDWLRNTPSMYGSRVIV